MFQNEIQIIFSPQILCQCLWRVKWIWVKYAKCCDILGSHSGDDKDSSIPWRYSLFICKELPQFLGIVLPSRLGQCSNPLGVISENTEIFMSSAK